MVDHASCPPGAHDRDPGTAIDEGQPVDEHGLLLCADCHAPLMYCATIHDYAHVDPTTPSCLLVAVSAVNLVVRIQREIAQDVAAGLIPIWVSSLWHLHDYVDVNTYGGLSDDNARVRTDTVVQVQAEVDRWLAARGHLPTFVVRTPDYEITRVNAATLSDARRVAGRHPHVRVVLADRGGTVTVEPTDLPGPGLRRARIRTGPHAGHLASFDADRDLAGLTRWIHDGGAYFDYEVEEVCAAWMPFATRIDGSPVVCDHPLGHDHVHHAARGEYGESPLTWKPATQV